MVAPMFAEEGDKAKVHSFEEILKHRTQSVPEMSAKIAHQWKQPLTILSMMLSGLSVSKNNALMDTDLEEFKKRAQQQIDYMFYTVETFSSYGRHSMERKHFSIENAVEAAQKLCSYFLKLDGIEVHVKSLTRSHVYGYQTEIVHVMVILFTNARDAILNRRRKDGRIFVGIVPYRGGYQVKISDNGGGIPAELLPDKLFENGLSTKQNQGSGMGLGIAKEIIENYFGGEIRVHNIQDGAEFTLVLPKRE